MSIFGELLIPQTDAVKAGRSTQLTGRSYDAAATSRHNENHWRYADGSDADFWIRQDLPTTRNRARYEVKNNSYAEGIIETLANDLVGTGPDLQMDTGNSDADSEIEEKFFQWSQDCDIEGKLNFGEILTLTGGRQQCESGEGLTAFVNIRRQKNWTRVRPEPLLRLRVIEPDRLASPYGLAGIVNDEKVRDGIEYDEDGRPLFYYIFKQHPGSATNFGGGFGDYDKVPASQMIHLYKIKRPGQSRGMPWVTPSLPLFAQLRRFTLATVQSAETAANVSGTIQTEAGTEPDEVEALDEVELPRNSFLTLPRGHNMSQVKPEHPAATYEMFKNEVINEIARCVCMPFNVAAANSAKYNYASGRLDWQIYYRFIRTIRSWLEAHECNRVFYAWLREGILMPGYFKYFKGNVNTARPEWNWPGSEHVDPKKEADAQNTRRRSLTTNLKGEYAQQGKDWERELRQIKKEKDLCEELGIPWQAEKKSENNKEMEDEDETVEN
ncbi:MAG: phage portal protein [Phycisphaerae bacterium]|nr:phage portal protein [Phycisphaerae bacterium]